MSADITQEITLLRRAVADSSLDPTDTHSYLRRLHEAYIEYEVGSYIYLPRPPKKQL